MKNTILWSAALLMIAIGLAGCSTNHKFNDDEYRPLGDPKTERSE
ncbi:type VI secretion protein [Halopseudomonas sp.]